MKTTKIIRDKKEVVKKLLNTMYESACAEKELLEMLLEEFEEEKSSQVQVKDEPRELIKGINGQDLFPQGVVDIFRLDKS